MQKFLILLMCTFICSELHSQDESMPDYLRNQMLPKFKLVAPDSSSISNKSLIRERKTMIILFNTHCDFCKKAVHELIINIDKLADVNIVLASFEPLAELQNFYKELSLYLFPNILMGRDERYFFAPYFEAKTVPFLALYNKEGILITTFDRHVSIDTLLKAFTSSLQRHDIKKNN